MGAWVEWAMVGTRDARRPARLTDGGDGSGLRKGGNTECRRGRDAQVGIWCCDGGGRGGEDDRGAVSAPRAAVASGSLLLFSSIGVSCMYRETVTFLAANRQNTTSAWYQLDFNIVATMRVSAR